MFNLITVVFSIILVLALGAAALYYGGEAVTSKTQQTQFAEIVNGADQIKAAMELYRSREGAYPEGVADPIAGLSSTEQLLQRLVAEDYLSAIPSGNWTISGMVIQRDLVDLQQCSNVNRIAGMNTDLAPNGCPPCSDATFSVWPACENV
jgi:hypothetical protein